MQYNEKQLKLLIHHRQMISSDHNSLVDSFGRLCFEKYKSLPKTGKPKENEWTVLSCIIQHDQKNNKSKVISLGTGTKCIGSHQLCAQGLILNDSHAEIIARRAFLRYLYDQLLKDNSDIFEYSNKTRRFNLKENISFHFFSTYPPCGDASITESIESGFDPPINKRIKVDSYQADDYSTKSSEIFTGAKLLCTSKNDLMDQEEGAVRTKPGRGIRTLSVSCSDKIARWNVMGLQGALLDYVLEEPIYLKSYNFCSNVNLESISRAFCRRWFHKSFTDNRFRFYQPEICNCSIELLSEFVPSDNREPCPASIIWCDVSEKSLEVAVSGKKQGVTKKNLNKKSSSLSISKAILLEKFKHLVKCKRNILNRFSFTDEELQSKSYNDLKANCIEYQTTWNTLKNEYIGVWTKKPENLKQFV